MHFTDEQIEIMQSIFLRLDIKTINSLQYYIPENEYRTGCTIVIKNKWNKPICIFQNFENLSPYRMKLLKRLSTKIPFPFHITQPREDRIRIGWKSEN